MGGIRTAETDPLWCGQAGCGAFIFAPFLDERGDWKGSDGHRHWPQGGRTGSSRQAFRDPETADCPHCKTESYLDDFTAERGRCPVCGRYNEELDMARRHSFKRGALDEAAYMEELDRRAKDKIRREYEFSGPYEDAIAVDVHEHPEEYRESSRHRTAAMKFLSEQNTDDRQELLFRAHRHASNLTGQLPVPVAQRMVRDFVAAVNAQIPRRRVQASRPVTQFQDFSDELLY